MAYQRSQSHFSEFQNEAWPSLDQLNGGFGAPLTFHLPPLSFEYSARQKCILSFGGDCGVVQVLELQNLHVVKYGIYTVK